MRALSLRRAALLSASTRGRVISEDIRQWCSLLSSLWVDCTSQKKKTRVVAIIIITYRLCVQERAVRCCGDGWCAQCRAHARQWTEVNEKRYICFLFVTFFFLLFREGITISDEDGRELGKSPAAGAVGAKSSFGSVFCINKFVVSLCACFFIIYL